MVKASDFRFETTNKSDTGLTEIDNNYKYGGNVDNDNSGSLTYVKICYAVPALLPISSTTD